MTNSWPTTIINNPPTDSRRGFAVAALTLGIVGTVFGLIPILFIIAIPCGILAIVFGVKARRAAMGKWGLGLGICAVLLGCAGVVIVGDAVEELDSSLTCLDRATTLAEIEAC